MSISYMQSIWYATPQRVCDLHVENPLEHFLCDWWGEGPAIVGGATPVLVFLQESHVEQDRQQHPSVASASVPSSSFLPFLRSCSDFLWWLTVSVSQVNPFFPNLAFGHMVFITAVRDPTTVTTSCFNVRSLGILENKWALILHTLSTPIVSWGQLDTLMF